MLYWISKLLTLIVKNMLILKFDIQKKGGARSLLHISLIDMPKTELRILCATIAEAAVRFYETPDHQADYERWLRLQEGGEGDRRDHSERASREISQSHAVGCCGAVSGPFPETALQIDRRRTEPV